MISILIHLEEANIAITVYLFGIRFQIGNVRVFGIFPVVGKLSILVEFVEYGVDQADGASASEARELGEVLSADRSSAPPALQRFGE